MITYPKTKIDKRWDNMSEKLREILYSPAYGETLLQLTDDHHLNDIKKEVVFKLVSFVIYGFIHKEELDKKIMNEIDVDKKVVEELVEEIDKKIFSHIEDELNDIYSPVSEVDTTIETIKPKTPIKFEESKTEKKPEEESGVDKEFIKSEFSDKNKEEEETDKNQPFIIHNEQKKEEGAEEKDDFSFSFDDFFEKKNKKKNKSFAKINIPKKESEKTVHYSEYKTPTNFKNKKSFINIPEKNQAVQNTKKIEKEEKKEPKEEKNKKDPSVSGNVIDLSNLN